LSVKRLPTVHEISLLAAGEKGNLMNGWESFYTQQLQHLNLLIACCEKGNLMNCWESFYTQQLQHLNLLVDEQQQQELNPLYALSWQAQRTTPQQSGTQAM
jgi:hypothetical protein